MHFCADLCTLKKVGLLFAGDHKGLRIHWRRKWGVTIWLLMVVNRVPLGKGLTQQGRSQPELWCVDGPSLASRIRHLGQRVHPGWSEPTPRREGIKTQVEHKGRMPNILGNMLENSVYA